jgi:hypothetical protein
MGINPDNITMFDKDGVLSQKEQTCLFAAKIFKRESRNYLGRGFKRADVF